MKAVFKITDALVQEIRGDLERPHPFAAERVGFIVARCSRSRLGVVILASRFMSVPDDGYVRDERFGALMNHRTILSAMQMAYSEKASIFHIHIHPGYGRPGFSRIDLQENAKFVQAFRNVQPEYPHGAIVMSDSDQMRALCWLPGKNRSQSVDQFTIVGTRLIKFE